MKKLALGVFAAAVFPAAAFAAPPAARDVLKNYADIALASYEDSLSTAVALKGAIDTLIVDPTEENLSKAKTAWLAARVPYQQTEAFRFGNPIVDEWEGKVNAWPLDEGLIDYVAPSYEGGADNPYARANVVANTKIKVGGKTIDTTRITKELLADKLQEAGKVETNVATGYHAVEFLLWGQDLNGTGPGAGARKATDYSKTNCTNGNCDRRALYLQTAAGLLIDDLQEMVDAWGAKGKARAEVVKAGEKQGLARILTGLGSLSYGELAGERMKLGLILHDPEEEHDCFSDNTHNAHYYDQQGIVNVYTGRYKRVDGTLVSGPSLSDYVVARAPEADAKVKTALAAATAAMTAIKTAADGGAMAYDQMIAAGNVEGNKLVQNGVDALVEQKKALETVVVALGVKIKIEGSDSLDDPSKVGK